MFKLSKILIFLVLIFHVHLTTTLPIHELEERNLTTLLANMANISDREFKRSLPFDPLRDRVIRRPANLHLPARLALIGSALACEKLRTIVAFCICCALNNRDVVIDTPRDPLRPQEPSMWSQFLTFLDRAFFGTPSEPLDRYNESPITTETRIQGPSLAEMFRQYRESEFYRYEIGNESPHNQITLGYCPDSEAIPDFSEHNLMPCLPRRVEDIVHPYIPSTSNPSTSNPSTSDPSTSNPYNQDVGVDYSIFYNEVIILEPPGFSQFIELLNSASITDPRTQDSLWKDYNEVKNKFKDAKEYLAILLEYAHRIGRSENLEGLSIRQYDKLEFLFCDDYNPEPDDNSHDELRKLLSEA